MTSERTKVVILAGGMGTRISEESHLKPKPLIEVGGKPIIWHIMKTFSHYGLSDFVICCGYKGYLIKEYFSNYFLHMSDVTFDMVSNNIEFHQKNAEPWRITLVDTGEKSQTGGRIARIRDYVDGTFLLTYGDGVANVDISQLMSFHKEEGAEVTVTAVQPGGRFGSLEFEGTRVHSFTEKPKGDGRWVNGGYFVCEPSIFSRIRDDKTIWEREPLESLSRDGQLALYKHTGFWAALDTMRDKKSLEELVSAGKAPWQVWL